MKYISTRGRAPVLGFDDVLLTGVAADGGLYVPERWPAFDQRHLALWSELGIWAELAIEVMRPYVEGAVDADAFGKIVHDAVATFEDPGNPCPLVDLGGGLWLLELFHGPSLAFKDVALQVVGRLMDHVLAERGEQRTILVATSGDTGSAAIEACRGRPALDIVVLFPEGRVSDVQRRQMTTVPDGNVRCLAVDGNFDDCQDLVKAMFADTELNERTALSAMNSINWARVLPQVAYYASSVATLGPAAFAVPSGNFGNAFAGDVARRMGLPVEEIVLGTNRNDVLHRWLSTGVVELADVVPTTSPSMDISVSSNLERLLWELYERNGHVLAEAMARLRSEGRIELEARQLTEARATHSSARFDDDEVASIIRRTWEEHGILVDPHTAIALGAARTAASSPDHPVVAMATASPAKFPDVVEAATGQRPALPERLADLADRPERFTRVPNELDAVRDVVLAGRTPA